MVPSTLNPIISNFNFWSWLYYVVRYSPGSEIYNIVHRDGQSKEDTKKIKEEEEEEEEEEKKRMVFWWKKSTGRMRFKIQKGLQKSVSKLIHGSMSLQKTSLYCLQLLLEKPTYLHIFHFGNLGSLPSSIWLYKVLLDNHNLRKATRDIT